MDNRDAILRRMAALRAKFQEGSGCTEEEANAAMEKYNSMMQQYNLQETDVHIKEQGVGESFWKYSEGKQKHEVYWCLSSIGKLSETKPIVSPQTNTVFFYGTEADRQYAKFLYDLCYNAIETSWKAFRYSFTYTKMNRNIHGKKIRYDFRMTMAQRLSERIRELASENVVKSTGTSLIVLKNQLIEAALADQKIRKASTAVSRQVRGEAVHHALNAANAVNLRKEMSETLKIGNGG
jgi:hypothetical protein